VGRREELEFISEAMTTRPGIVLAGASGIGKTRLAYEAVQAADPARFMVRRSAATSATAPIPFGALAPLLPVDLPAAPDRPNLLRFTADAMLSGAEGRRLLLSIDDAHLLDETSAALVYQLAQSGRSFVLASVRSGERAPVSVTALWKEDLTPRLEVQALSEAETRDVLVAALDGEVDGSTSRRLWQAARGNMLLLRELVDAGREGGALTEIKGVWRWDGPFLVAPRLSELITERVGRLDRAQQHVLELTAYSEPIGADLLAGLTDAQVLVDLEAKALLWTEQSGNRTEVRLAHPLYGEVLRARCPYLRARAICRTLADTVQRAGARRKDDMLRIAGWRMDAAAPVESAVLVAAAHRAFAVLDLPLAERLARKALDEGGGAAAGEVLWRALFLDQRSHEAEKVMAGLAGLPMTDSQRGETAFGMAYILFWGQDRVDDAFAVLRRARTEIAEPFWHDEIELLENVFWTLLGDTRRAAEGLAGLLGRPQLSPRTHAQALVLHGMLLCHTGRLMEAIDVLDQAAEPLSQWVHEVPWVAETRWAFRTYALIFDGRLPEAEAEAAAFYTHALETGWEFPLRLSCALQAHIARLRGRVRTAARWARESRRQYGRQPLSFFYNFVIGELAHDEALAGEATTAAATLAEADLSPLRGEALFQPWVELARPAVAAAGGNRAEAIELAGAAADFARRQRAVPFEALALHDVIRLSTARTAAVLAAADRLAALAAASESGLVGGLASHAGAIVRGDAEDLERAALSLAGMGADLMAAEAFARAATVHQQEGRTASARRLRTRVALLLDRCEGATTPVVTDLRAPQLTARERDIARLAVEGLSNQQIAERLVISKRTVDNHLHQIYGKLGIGGRADLAALLFPDP
jgi:ATP/maltotriose-dependent transcriptional regulator MalT